MAKNNAQSKLSCYIGIDTAYYTMGKEFALLNPGDIAINVSQDLNDYHAA
jgi:hypothetical protein